MSDPVTIPSGARWTSSHAAVSWALSALGLVLFGGYLVSATSADLHRLGVLPLTPPEVVQDVVVRHAEDRSGREASFRILLFSDEFRWKLSSSDALDNTLEQPEFTDGMKVVLNGAREIICVGASSEELRASLSPDEGQAFEERRAARRAEQIAIWVRSALSTPVAVRKLNVGHHLPTGGQGDTSDQRRVVIILVLEQDQGADIDQALRSAMERERSRAPIFESLLTRYSLSSGDRFTWVP